MGNRRNCTKKYDRKRDPEERREEMRQSRKRKIEEISNIEGENQSQLEVEAGMYLTHTFKSGSSFTWCTCA